MNKAFKKYGILEWLLIIFSLAGIVSLLVLLFLKPENFFGNVLSIASITIFLALFFPLFYAIHHTSKSRWIIDISGVLKTKNHYFLNSLIYIIILIFGWNHLYDWATIDLTAKKSWYLNIPFFITRSIIILALWWFYFRKIKKTEFEQKSNYTASFLIVFVFTLMFFSWDWLMAIDVHWYSTLFTWYLIPIILTIGISVLLLNIFFLEKTQNKEFKDISIKYLASYLFVFSIFWAYLWYSQFMLIWYANLPHETDFLVKQLTQMPFVFYLILIMNFVIPFFSLMHPYARTNRLLLSIISIIIITGHLLELQLIIFSVKGFEFGVLDVLAGVGFMCFTFLFLIYNQKAEHA
jgi:hypothetical protein